MLWIYRRMYLQFHIQLYADPFPCTWEDAARALEALPRMIFEPDGSWVWSAGEGDGRWQVDGHLFDFDGRLHRVELHGGCPPDAFDVLLECFGGPQLPLRIELVREGTGISEAEFRRRWLGGGGQTGTEGAQSTPRR